MYNGSSLTSGIKIYPLSFSKYTSSQSQVMPERRVFISLLLRLFSGTNFIGSSQAKYSGMHSIKLVSKMYQLKLGSVFFTPLTLYIFTILSFTVYLPFSIIKLGQSTLFCVNVVFSWLIRVFAQEL